ncbi:hypothetical protein [Microcoleus sp. B13-B4]|uniref:hypothetical protein n=1 Tax=unclassified Microcoleus TaxID=2642155 RepID=UPI002FD01182
MGANRERPDLAIEVVVTSGGIDKDRQLNNFPFFLWDGRPARPERTGGTPIPQQTGKVDFI